MTEIGKLVGFKYWQNFLEIENVIVHRSQDVWIFPIFYCIEAKWRLLLLFILILNLKQWCIKQPCIKRWCIKQWCIKQCCIKQWCTYIAFCCTVVESHFFQIYVAKCKEIQPQFLAVFVQRSVLIWCACSYLEKLRSLNTILLYCLYSFYSTTLRGKPLHFHRYHNLNFYNMRLLDQTIFDLDNFSSYFLLRLFTMYARCISDYMLSSSHSRWHRTICVCTV